VFDELTLHGATGKLLWLHRRVADLTHWRIYKTPRAWTLTATFDRADAWQCQQAAKYRELVFTAPRGATRFTLEVKAIHLAGTELRATLGLPLQ
jgi:hypothetical protein